MPRIKGYLSTEAEDPRSSLEPKGAYIGDSPGFITSRDKTPAFLIHAGDSMSQMGLKLIDQDRKSRQVTDAAEAQIDGISKLGELYKASVNNRAGYDTALDTYKEQSKAVIDDILGKMTDPEVKATVGKSLGMYRVQHSVELQGHILEFGRKEYQAKLADRVEKWTDLSGATDLGTTDFNEVIKRGTADIVASGQAYGMDPVQIQKLDKSFREGVSRNQVLRIMNNGDTGPQQAIDMINSGAVPHLDPGTREVLINTANRRQQAINTKRDADIRRSIAYEEHLERKVDKETEKWMDANFSNISVLIDKPVDENGNRLSQPALRSLINKAAENREIGPKHIMQLEDKLRRNMEGEKKDLHRMIDDSFRTRGPFEQLDPVNEQRRMRLKREADERLRKGEHPESIFNEIYDREQREVPRSPGAFPTPQLLTGDKTDVAALKEAAEKTAASIDAYNAAISAGKSIPEARKVGMDPIAGQRELRNLKQLIESVTYQNKVKAEAEEAAKKSGNKR